MTYRETAMKLTEDFRNAGVPEPKADALVLMLYVTGLSKAGFLLKDSEEVPEADAKRIEELRVRRVAREPIQHLTGVQNFMGFDFKVSADCLIPRFDTEILAEQALFAVDELAPSEKLRILDLCTGSGCVIVALAALRKPGYACACDISPKALELARSNAEANHVKVDFILSDLFEKVTGEFDIITANPPYIASREIGTLEPEVKEHEPMLALDGGEDGLYFYRRITAEAGPYLKKGGYILMEIGETEAESVESMLSENGFSQVHTVKDLAGMKRVVCGRKLDV